ncbi:MAG: hypothetical protein Q8Q95_00895 [bacterium]|nr:hypothetical protein [bacterium]
MRVTKCDLCKKNIKGEPIIAGYGFWHRSELCQHCGIPVFDFLKNNKLVKEDIQLKVPKKGK